MKTIQIFLPKVSHIVSAQLCLVILLSMVFGLLANTGIGQEDRTWSSKSGKFTKQAALVERKGDLVVLRLGDGKTIEIPISSLSKADRDYLAALRNSPRDESKITTLRGANLGAELEKKIALFHSNEKKTDEVLRVIYFIGSDNEPQANYEGRLHRVMRDVQGFYHEHMKKNGFRNTAKMPLELKDGKLVVHLVKSKRPMQEFGRTATTAYQIRKECLNTLSGKVDFESDYTFIFCGLTRFENQVYLLNGPSYGLPYDHTRGCSFASDSEKFDPDFINETQVKIAYGYPGKVKNKTLAAFVAAQTGGVAHELGHALNLPHNGQTKRDNKRRGTALMGSGNYVYKQEVWDKKSKGAYMTLASSLCLAAHPLFTGSDKDRWKVAKCELKQVEFSLKSRRFEIKGVVESSPPPLAVIAFVDPADGTSVRDYDATTWVSGVGADGRFSVSVESHDPGTHDLRLVVLMSNGAVKTPVSVQYDANKKGEPDLERLNSIIQVRPIENLLANGKAAEAEAAAKKKLASEKRFSELALAQLNHIIALAQPQKIVNLPTVEGQEVYLSDVQWESAIVGAGEPARNRRYVPAKRAKNPMAGVLLQVGGKLYEKGIFAAANSCCVFHLDGKWNEFESVVGLQTGSPARVKFLVKGDGRILHQTKEIAGSGTETIKLSVKDVKKLELIAVASQDNKKTLPKIGTPLGSGWTVWASPQLRR